MKNNILKGIFIVLILFMPILLGIVVYAKIDFESSETPSVWSNISYVKEPTNSITNDTILNETNQVILVEEEPIYVAPIILEPPYHIKVNYEANVVTIYHIEDNGDYTPVKAMICSTGTDTPTSGIYNIGRKWLWQDLYQGVYGHYATLIVSDILFHSVPYTVKYDHGSIEYWEYDKLGTACSLGCIRLQVIDAKWIYDNCDESTGVEFYADPNPGPLGKPTFTPISSDEIKRGWDPTDPDPNNPW